MSVLNVETIRLGLTNLRLHKLRSLLTALGIIFGVAAVICMLSISEGATADELRMIQLLGTQNIIITSVKPPHSNQASARNTQLLEFGITKRDAAQIKQTIPHLERVVPLKTIAFQAQRRATRMDVSVVGTTPEFFPTVNVEAARGRVLSDADGVDFKSVCVIGDDVRKELFPVEDPVGQSLFVQRREGLTAFTVIGVLHPVKTTGAPARGVQERNINREIYVPYETTERRFGPITVRGQSGSFEAFKTELSGMYIRVSDLPYVIGVSEMVKRVFECNHEQIDYDIRVPLRSLQLAEKKKKNSQMVLGSIAGISLLVGGIGIMNIMLATVTERTREIGIRRALGAKRRHITVQFLIETVVLSTTGGLFGIGLGCLGSWAVTFIAQWGDAIIQPWAVTISFGLSVLVGIFFGLWPATKAARLDPIEALRYE